MKRTALLPFALPELGEAELNQIKEVLESGWITTGPKTHQFEQRFADYLGVKFAVAVNSCTAAMHLSLEAVGVEAGDYVVTTPYTFAATAEVIRHLNATPVFVDVDRDTLKPGDFVFPDERDFPIVTPGDVADAVSSWGRYQGAHTFAQFQRRLTGARDFGRSGRGCVVRNHPMLVTIEQALRMVKLQEWAITRSSVCPGLVRTRRSAACAQDGARQFGP